MRKLIAFARDFFKFLEDRAFSFKNAMSKYVNNGYVFCDKSLKVGHFLEGCP